jgi:ankyrin repeat protein
MNPTEYSWRWKWNSLPWNYADWPSQASALWIAAATNLVDSTKSLLEGAALSQHPANQAIIVASYYGHTEIVDILLDKGADVNAAGGECGSSLQAAAQGGHTEIAEMLREWGARVL